ncbi:MAG: hypothetical protein KF749_10150 [Bacteroidetes bacterium]|nr:hypothetical protein [Bacteroidota bacterium]MCW5896675.1 hypothetical protein [Bacteroidota bacterium]
MKSLHALIIPTFILFGRCSDKPPDSVSVSPASILSVLIPDTVRLGSPITLEASCGTPTPCWEFERFEFIQHDKQINTTVFARYDGRPCVQVLGSFKADTSVVVGERGTYTFRFNRGEDSFFERSVVVQ